MNTYESSIGCEGRAKDATRRASRRREGLLTKSKGARRQKCNGAAFYQEKPVDMTDLQFREGMVGRYPGSRAQAARQAAPTGEEVLAHYFKRIDPDVAASFTREQREALKTMLGARGIAHHSLEVRRRLRLGKRRFYLVFLLGKENRMRDRLMGDRSRSDFSETLSSVGMLCLWLSPLVLAAIALRWMFGGI